MGTKDNSDFTRADSFPAKIEIIPLRGLAPQVITIPGSKSITNRALILAACSSGQIILKGGLWSEDTQVMTEALRKIGIEVRIFKEAEPANREFRLCGLGDRLPLGGTLENPLEIFVGNSGTSARFLAAFLCASGGGFYRLSGVPRMHQRPQKELFIALRQLGYTVLSEKEEGFLPAVIGAPRGKSTKGGACCIGQKESSQFASGLLLSARQGRWRIELEGETSPYIRMTCSMLEVFPRLGGEFQIEPDASGGSYFYAANIWAKGFPLSKPISVVDWPKTDWQADASFPDYMPLPDEISRERDLGDSIMTAIILAPLADKPIVFRDLGRLRVQECERVSALRRELSRCGARVEEIGDTLKIYPSRLHGAEIETYQDHRMAMCFTVLGLGIPGMVIKNPGCVVKSFPNFFDKVAQLRSEK